ncbi:MAG: DNA repair and recombination protein RadA [Promethearchaeota archaeon]
MELGEFLKREVSETIAEEIAAHYSSLAMLAFSSPEEVAKACNIGIRKAQDILKAAREAANVKPITAAELLDQTAEHPKITTGSQNLDEILGGGISTGGITEFSGSYGTGKTQLAFQLCITTQLTEDRGGLEGSVYFIDSEGTFSPRRLAEMVVFGGYDSNPKKFLGNVIVSRALNASHQVLLVEEADKLIKSKNIKLIVVDSVAAHFRVEFTGQKEIPRRQQILMRWADTLRQYVDSYGIGVMITNQVIANPDALLSSDSLEPALGYAWGHRPTHRVLLRKSRGSARIARVFDSPELAEREAVFFITTGGIRDRPDTDYY